MEVSFVRHLLLLVWVLATLGSCGGGGSDGGGFVGSGIGSGAVTAFGSIESNGAVYNTDNADFTVDGQAGASQSDLHVGQVVQIRFDQSGLTRTATSVVYEDVVEGPVTSVAADCLSLVVLGQSVLLNETTIVESSIPDVCTLTGTPRYEVSGHVKAKGVIAATFIELKAGPDDFEVKGFVENHDPGADTFTIGTLTVNYSTLITPDMPAEAAGWDGLLVEVKGTGSAPLNATRVEPVNHVGDHGDVGEIEGFVTRVDPSGDFFLGHVRIRTTSSTIFAGGLPEEVVAGVKLEVDGAFLSGPGLGEKVLVATRVSFRATVVLESDAATVAASTLTLRGLTGITVHVNSQTELKGLTSLADIDPSDPINRHLQIRGRPTGVGTVIATELELLRFANTHVVLQGTVESKDNPRVVILGLRVAYLGDQFYYEDINGVPITDFLYFRSITPNETCVKVQGVWFRTYVIWEKAELEE